MGVYRSSGGAFRIEQRCTQISYPCRSSNGQNNRRGFKGMGDSGIGLPGRRMTPMVPMVAGTAGN
jgi:hypothetical protein